MHFLQIAINTFEDESCLHQKVLFSKYVSSSWNAITFMHSEKWCTPFKDIFHMLTYTMFSFLTSHMLWKGHCMCKRFIFDIEVHMSYFNGMLYSLRRNARVEGSTHFKEMHHFCQGNRLTCLNMCSLNVLTQQCQYQHILVLKTHWPNMLLHRLLKCVEKRTKIELPNPCPKALSFPQWFLRGKELGLPPVLFC